MVQWDSNQEARSSTKQAKMQMNLTTTDPLRKGRKKMICKIETWNRHWDILKMPSFWGMHLKITWLKTLRGQTKCAWCFCHCLIKETQFKRKWIITEHWMFWHSLKHTCSRSTSSASFMFLVWIWSISSLPVASGMPMSTSLSKRPEIKSQSISTRCSFLRCSARSQNINWKHLCKYLFTEQHLSKVISPNRLRAGSMLLGLLVAAMTMTWALCFSPSIKVSSWDTMRLSTSPWVWKNRWRII